jgi:hypothetical protein
MSKQFSVRCGNTYKVVLAIILPCILIVPFIFLMQNYKPMAELKAWFIVFAFLGVLIFSSKWLALKIYPTAVLSISKNEISLVFDSGNFLSPSNFSFNFSDINSLTSEKIMDGKYFTFQTKNPVRNFQVSLSTNDIDDLLSFIQAMAEINEIVNKLNKER